jgi:SAM-dependent methyltransferase
MFRAPTTSPEDSHAFYQGAYDSGFTTQTPSKEGLKDYIAKGFMGSPKDFRRYIDVLKTLGAKPGDRILDFGCSWGYGTWQLKQHGFDVIGHDVSEARVAYARNELGVEARSDLEEVTGKFDFVFSAHVLEHVPSPKEALKFALDHLADCGLIVAVTPNGSFHRRFRHPDAWTRAWGQKHPNLLDEVFYLENLGQRPLLITSNLADTAAIKEWSARSYRTIGPLDGSELLLACRREVSQ